MRLRVELDLAPAARQFMTDLARALHRRADRLEHKMSQISDHFTAENATLDTITTTLADVAADVTALLATAGGAGVFSPEEQVLANAATAKLTALGDALGALDAAVGDRDGSGGPTPPSV